MDGRSTIIPAPARVIRVTPMTPDVRGLIVDTSVSMARDLAAIGSLVAFIAAILTNL